MRKTQATRDGPGPTRLERTLPAKEEDKSMRKPRDKSMRTGPAAHVSALAMDNKIENLPQRSTTTRIGPAEIGKVTNP